MLIRRQSGLSALEFGLIVVIVGILMVAFLTRLMSLNTVIERHRVQLTIYNIETALALAVVQYLYADERHKLAELIDSNPMANLVEPPANYLGERRDPAADAPPGHWYFDPHQGLLVYRLRYPQQIQTTLENPARLRFRVVAGGSQGGSLDKPRLRAEEPFIWLTRDG